MTNSKKSIKAAGCFPAGTRVNTPAGYRLIEDIRKGDLVYAFDLRPMEAGEDKRQPGRVFEKKVKSVSRHSFGEVGYTSPLLEISYRGSEYGTLREGKLLVTGNHYILTPSRQSEGTDEGFARADELQVGDTIWTEFGEPVAVTAVEAGGEYDYVYNFEVTSLHTYIAGGIRVHNGGGGKGGSHTAVQAANTTRTKQVIRALFLPSEGEVGGLYHRDDIARSVFFDGTPLKNEDGTFNFNNVEVSQRTGLPSQEVIPGFSAVESEALIGIALTSATPTTRTVSSAEVDAVRATVEFPTGLQVIDTKNGDANGTAVSFTFSRRVAGGTWENVVNPTIREMSSGAFTASFMIPRPAAAGVWEWRAQRTTADSTSNNLINATNLKSFTEIQNVNLPYDNRALVAITVGADSTNGKIPSVSLDMVGMYVRVPSNYNPATRVYTGSWDGTFSPTLQWTDNPAWVLYDLLLANRYGMGQEIAAAQVDKWSFYAMARYNDELVPDGKGTGTYEPRFTFNAQLMVQEQAWKTLNTIAAVANAKVYVHAGMIRVAQDSPSTPTRLINNSNVIDGMFTYSSTAAEDTYTQCNVTYNDPLDNFLPRTVTEMASEADRVRHGTYATDIAAYGCTSEGQARRAAKWVIDTSVRQTSLVTFTVSLENAAFEPHEVFYLMDEDYSQATQEGRLVSRSGTLLTLDKAITKTTGTWRITVYGSDGVAIEERTITSAPGTSATVTVDRAITSPPGSPYIVTGAVSPRMFRMVSMTDRGGLTYEVTALEYDANKYPRIEGGIVLPDPVYWQLPRLNTVDTPTNMTITPQTSTNADGMIYRFLNVAWEAPADGTAVGYQVQWRRDGQPLETKLIAEAFVRIPADFSGLYEVYVNAINAAGVSSPTLSGMADFNIEGSSGSSVGAVTNLTLLGGGTTIDGGSMTVTWSAPPQTSAATLRDYKVELQTPGGNVFRTFYTTDTFFTYTYEQNIADGGPRTTIKVNVSARDTLNRTGGTVSNTFSSIVNATVSGLTVRGGGGTVFNTLDLDIEWTSDSSAGTPFKNDPNFGYFKVEVLKGSVVQRIDQVTDSNYTYTFSNNVKDNGQDTPSANIVVRVTAVSRSGVSSASGSATFTPAAPPSVSSLFVKGTTGTVFNEPDVNVTWVCNDAAGKEFAASNMFKTYRVEALNGTSLKRSETSPSPFYSYFYNMNAQDNAGSPTRSPSLRVSAVNVYNVSSAPVTTQFNNPVPAVPANLQVLPGIGNYKVVFDKPPETDYVGAFIWASTTPDFTPSPSNLVANITGSYATINSQPETKYYVRVAAYDVFGQNATNGAGLTVSSQSTVAALSAGLLSLDVAPTSGMKKGDVYINTTFDPPKLFTYDGSAWKSTIAAQDVVGGIQSTQIADGAIKTPQLDANAVTAINLAADAVVARNIKAGTMSTDKFLANSIDGNILTVNTVNGDRIKAATLDVNTATAVLITSDKIDTRGLTVKDNAGNVILSSGVPLDSSRVVASAGWLNSNVTPAGIGAISTSLSNAPASILNSNVTPASIGAVNLNLSNAPAGIVNGNVTIGANGVLQGAGGGQVTVAGLDNTIVRSANPITPANVSTYIAAAAISSAYIGDAQISRAKIQDGAINNAKIGDAEISTAKIGDAQITYAKIGDAQIGGVKLYDGGVTAQKLSVYSLDAVTARIGTLRTGTSGGRMELADNQIRIYDEYNVLRVVLGAL